MLHIPRAGRPVSAHGAAAQVAEEASSDSGGTDSPASRKLRIALGIHRLEPKGGLEDHCLRIAAELRRRGHSVRTFVARSDPSSATDAIALCGWRLTNHALARHFAERFRRATATGFDVTVAFQPVPGADVLFIGDPLRDRGDAKFVRRMMPRFRTFAALERGCFDGDARTRVLGLAEAQMRSFRDRYATPGDRIKILPPSIAKSRYRPHLRFGPERAAARARLDLAPGEIVWLWIGLQPRVKGLDRVVEALADAPAGTRLVVCGLSPNSARLGGVRRQARRLGVLDRIGCLGFLPGEDMPTVMAAADVLAHPARHDTTGAAILEAIINGLPVVASGCCGFAEHVRLSGAGKVVDDPFDQSAFHRALAEVVGSANGDYARRGIDYGRRRDLFGGIAAAADAVEEVGVSLSHMGDKIPQRRR
jgi:UDP-glucose:(heptosyl)LPS alpha-1,3-glucosyltransferase